jgi:hypothetical protein
MMLSLPVLVELAIVMAVVHLVKKHAGDAASLAKQLVVQAQQTFIGSPSRASVTLDDIRDPNLLRQAVGLLDK